MPFFVKLAGHAGASRQRSYEGWVEVSEIDFTQPMLEKEPATFTINKSLDALSRVFGMKAADGSLFRYVRLHAVDEAASLMKIRFDKVAVDGFTIDGKYDRMMERVTFAAEQWRHE